MSNASINPLLGRVKLPGKVYQLPSKGVFYAEGVLATSVNQGEIQVKPMSALTELKIRSADLLFSNKILREVCGECAPEVLLPEKLISKDVDALFTFLVAATYGNNKSIRAMHECKDAAWHDYDVNLEPIIADPRNGVLDHRNATFSVEMPNKQIVKLKPVSFEESIILVNYRNEIARKEEGTITHEDRERVIISELLAVIEAVEDVQGGETIRVTSQKQIEEWIREIPKKFIDMIARQAAVSAEWGFNFTVDLKCKDCGVVYPFDLELNPVNFFTG